MMLLKIKQLKGIKVKRTKNAVFLWYNGTVVPYMQFKDYTTPIKNYKSYIMIALKNAIK